MALTFTWLQSESYSAAQDRHLLYALTNGQPRVLRGLRVVAPGPGQNPLSVNIEPGSCVVLNNDDDLYEAAEITVTADVGGIENWLIAAPPAPGEECNLVVGFGPIVDGEIDQFGNLGQSCGPVPHNTVPGWGFGSVVLAIVKVRGPVITPGDITDRRQIASYGYEWGTAPPSQPAPPGTVYVQAPS